VQHFRHRHVGGFQRLHDAELAIYRVGRRQQSPGGLLAKNRSTSRAREEERGVGLATDILPQREVAPIAGHMRLQVPGQRFRIE
jgi:hypothetical protein